jgi:hypothetical protein
VYVCWMKFILFILIVVCPIQLLAQDNWLLQFDIEVPIIINDHAIDREKGTNTDSTSVATTTFNTFSTPIKFIKTNDNISIAYWSGLGGIVFWGNAKYSISFEIDYQGKKIKNFFIKYSADTTFDFTTKVSEDASLQIDSVSFVMSPDSGFELVDDSIFRKINKSSHTGSLSLSRTGNEYYSRTFTEDSLSAPVLANPYVFHISLSKSIESVPSAESELDKKILYFSLLKRSLIFSPSSAIEHFLIYDILGREAYHTEIPSGMTEFLLPAHFPSGYYFARLGNMTGHFVVY